MANYATLKAAISQVIKENGNKEITGEIMQTTLLSMINSLGANYQFAGILTPSTSFVAPDDNVFFIGGGGTYNNFGTNQIVVPRGYIGIFMYNGSYTYSVLQGNGVLDVSVLNAVNGVPTQYSTLQNALNAIPSNLRYNGMEIIYIDSNTEQYVKYRMIAKEWSVLSIAWQGIDDEPIVGSNNLLKSGRMQHWLTNEQNIIRPTIPYAYMGSSSDSTYIYSNNFDNIIKAYGIEIYAPAGDIDIYKVNVKNESNTLIKTVTIPYLGTHTFMFDAPVELSSNEFIGTKGVLKFINSSTLPSGYYRKGRGGYGNYGYLPNLQVSFSVLINNVDNELGENAEIDEINAELNSTLLYKPTPIDVLNVTDSAHLYGNRYGMLSKVYGITIISSGTVEIYKLNFLTKEYELIDTHNSSGNYVKDTHLFSVPVTLGETEIIATKGSVKYSNTATPHIYPKIPCGIETEVSALPNFQLAVEILTTIRDTFNTISDKCAQFAANNKNIDDLIFDYSVDAVNDIICIGDSMTEGVIVDYENLHVAAATYLTYSYPAVLGHLTGWNIENAGYHDIDALNWWTHIFNRYEYSNYKVALIELGQNNGLTDTLVQDTTISEGQTYLDYANTNTGSYCKIIEGLIAANSRILIVVIISPRIDATTRSVILQIIAKYNLPFIDLKDHSMINLEDNKYHGKNYQGGIDYIHYSRAGYVAKAILIKNSLGTIINNNTNIMNTYPDSPSQNPTDWHS